MSLLNSAAVVVERFYGLSPEFDRIVHRVIESIGTEKLFELKKDFHTRLRITQAHPDRPELVEYLWDFFYDWCIFEQKVPDSLSGLSPGDISIWERLKSSANRGVFLVQKMGSESVKLKELYSGKSLVAPVSSAGEFFGISKGDLVECRVLVPAADGKATACHLVRRPCYHPVDVHDYLIKKVRQFKKAQDYSTYQNWLWLVVGMYLKHRIYAHMPVEKIYDDNSRI